MEVTFTCGGMVQRFEIDHTLKTWPDVFKEIQAGRKLHEFRKNDRGFELGDKVLFREFEPVGEVYSGAVVLIEISSISYGPEWGIPDGFCAFSIREINRADAGEWELADA